MLVKEIMSKGPGFLSPDTPIKKAAEEMARLDCGFIPVGDGDRLLGTVTDRDIAVRAIAKGKDPSKTPVKDVMTAKVLYVFEDDDLAKAANSMKQQKIRRLIVLNKDKRMTGIVSLGDLATKCKDANMCSQVITSVSEKAH
jgi:CBS domain-containing protein